MVEDDSPLKEPLDLPEDATTHQPPSKNFDPKLQKKGGKKIVVVLLILIVVAGLGFLGWKLLTKPKSEPEGAKPSGSSTSQPKSDLPKASGTKAYTNDIMRLTLTYPNNWTVSEESGSTFIESPTFSYSTTNKGDVTGVFRIYIHQSATTSDSKAFGRGLAIMPSEKLVYANPAPSQRKETFLSFFGLDNTDNFAYLLIAGNFDLKKGDSLGPNYGKEMDTIIIGGGYTTKEQKEGLTNSQVPVDSFQNTDAYKQAVDILKSIQIN